MNRLLHGRFHSAKDAPRRLTLRCPFRCRRLSRQSISLNNRRGGSGSFDQERNEGDDDFSESKSADFDFKTDKYAAWSERKRTQVEPQVRTTMTITEAELNTIRKTHASIAMHASIARFSCRVLSGGVPTERSEIECGAVRIRSSHGATRTRLLRNAWRASQLSTCNQFNVRARQL